MTNWRLELTSAGEKLGEVKRNEGIFQGDSVSPILLVVHSLPIMAEGQEACQEICFDESIIFEAITEIWDDENRPDKRSIHSNLLKEEFICTEGVVENSVEKLERAGMIQNRPRGNKHSFYITDAPETKPRKPNPEVSILKA